MTIHTQPQKTCKVQSVPSSGDKEIHHGSVAQKKHDYADKLNDDLENNNDASTQLESLDKSLQIASTLLITQTGGYGKKRKAPTKVKDAPKKQQKLVCKNDSDEDDCQIFAFTNDLTQFGYFKPTCSSVKKTMCSKINIKYVNMRATCKQEIYLKESVPKRRVNIKGDGNCLFRALSYAISNTEENHFVIRKTIVDHLSQPHCRTFVCQQMCTKEHELIAYIHSTNMLQNGIWGTNVEILAACHLLEVQIFIFDPDGTWKAFGLSDLSHPCVYLDHSLGNHYNGVIRIEKVHIDDIKSNITTAKSVTIEIDEEGPDGHATEYVADKECDIYAHESARSSTNDAQATLETIEIDAGSVNGESSEYASGEESAVHTYSSYSDGTAVVETYTRGIQGTMSQHDPTFNTGSGIGYGINCAMNCMTFLLKRFIDHSSEITPDYIDDTLICGIELYREHINFIDTDVTGYLAVTDLPNPLVFDRNSYGFTYHVFGGVIEYWCHEETMTIDECITSAFSIGDSCLVTYAGNTVCIYCKNNGESKVYYLFDPHSRDEAGAHTETGKAVVICCSSLQRVISTV
jgi:hypothetical protein